jgi:HD-like signal output (HDOD) protein
MLIFELVLALRHTTPGKQKNIMNPTVDEESALKELVARGIKIPPWPKVLMELQQALASGDTDARAIANIISKDPSISSIVFKVAKSPVVSRGQKGLDRLDRILMVLGIKQILNLVQAVALTTALSNAQSKAFDVFWTRSSEVADLAALIAEDRVSVCNVFADQAYMAGIFWDCGIPVLMQRFPDYCQKIPLETADWPSIELEDQRFSVDHYAIGYLVARHWKLPDFIASAIHYHGEMPREELGSVRSLVAILHLAKHYYNGLKGVETPNWAAMEPEVLAELGLHPDAADEFRADIEERYNAS